jgi:hypothetical protein
MYSNPDYLQAIGESGGVPPLMMISRSLNVNTQCLALAALRRLADCQLNWISNFQSLNEFILFLIFPYDILSYV